MEYIFNKIVCGMTFENFQMLKVATGPRSIKIEDIK